MLPIAGIMTIVYTLFVLLSACPSSYEGHCFLFVTFSMRSREQYSREKSTDSVLLTVALWNKEANSLAVRSVLQYAYGLNSHFLSSLLA